VPSTNYYTISSQVDKLSAAVFNYISLENFHDIASSLFKECLFLIPADSYVAAYDINDDTQQFMDVPRDYNKKY
jgi:hypothetical protein